MAGAKYRSVFAPRGDRLPPGRHGAVCADASCGEPTNRVLWGLKMHGFTLAIENAVGKREAVVGLDKRRSNSPPRIPPERFFRKPAEA